MCLPKTNLAVVVVGMSRQKQNGQKKQKGKDDGIKKKKLEGGGLGT